MNFILYLVVVLIWGTTWIAIYLQQGSVPVLVSIFWRFAIAGGLMLVINQLIKRRQSLTLRDHCFCLLQGLCSFSLNFCCFYLAAAHITTGIESVIFSMAVLFNAINQAIFYRIIPPTRFWPAAALGLIGMVVLFADQLFGHQLSWSLVTGIVLSLLGTFGFSLGNMLSIRHQRRGLDILTTNSWAMCYGALVAGALAGLSGASFLLPWQPSYLGALLYLAIFGSIIGFGAYYSLVGRIGAGKAAYTTVLFPLVALTLSTFFEGYHWQSHGIVGLCLILLGNVVMFFPPQALRRKSNSPLKLHTDED